MYQIHSFTSGLGREQEEVPTRCTQMGTLTTVVGAVGGDLPAALRCLEGPEALLTSSFTEREAAWGFQPSAAINTSIETEGSCCTGIILD